MTETEEALAQVAAEEAGAASYEHSLHATAHGAGILDLCANRRERVWGRHELQ